MLAESRDSSLPAPPPLNTMIYDRLVEFLKYGSPHPVLRTHTHILSAPETRVTTLSNCIRVATESSLSAKTMTIGVSIDVGSRFKTAYFLEHMIFKVTEKRSAREPEEELLHQAAPCVDLELLR
ncbi:unnamed protein product [Linum tenue]|uniref:Peptidase M16 N-terminal domain-containing protein n=1 Tax=Linum tenue TaxID=586396 RepID=A0AAV0QS30_9ROSI|nr:unnamed protein product [Linum tenue]